MLLRHAYRKPRVLPPPNNSVFDERPVVQRLWIEVCAIGPLKAASIIDQTDTVEQCDIAQGAKDRAVQDRRKVNYLLGFIVETYAQGVIANNRKIGDSN